MDFKEFEETVKNLDKNKYHISRTLRFTETGEPYIDSWSIFRKNMSTEEYFNPNNLAILSSKNNNTIKDIDALIVKENKIQGKTSGYFFSDVIKEHKDGKLS